MYLTRPGARLSRNSWRSRDLPTPGSPTMPDDLPPPPLDPAQILTQHRRDRARGRRSDSARRRRPRTRFAHDPPRDTPPRRGRPTSAAGSSAKRRSRNRAPLASTRTLCGSARSSRASRALQAARRSAASMPATSPDWAIRHRHTWMPNRPGQRRDGAALHALERLEHGQRGVGRPARRRLPPVRSRRRPRCGRE